jgi:hypothetical protein
MWDKHIPSDDLKYTSDWARSVHIAATLINTCSVGTLGLLSPLRHQPLPRTIMLIIWCHFENRLASNCCCAVVLVWKYEFQYIFPLMKKLYENFNVPMELAYQSKMYRLSLGYVIALLMHHRPDVSAASLFNVLDCATMLITPRIRNWISELIINVNSGQ